MRLLIATTLAIVCCTTSLVNAAVSDSYLEEWLERRVETLEARFDYRPFDRIGWAKDLTSAMKLGAEHNRPVFVFTHDGHINSGRC